MICRITAAYRRDKFPVSFVNSELCSYLYCSGGKWSTEFCLPSGKCDRCLWMWAWRVWGFWVILKRSSGFWAEREERRRGIHINAINLHRPCLSRWFFSWWRERSNGHINYKLSINVTDVGLASPDCRITQRYGSTGPLDKHNCDGGQQRVTAPSAPTASWTWVWCSD